MSGRAIWIGHNKKELNPVDLFCATITSSLNQSVSNNAAPKDKCASPKENSNSKQNMPENCPEITSVDF